MIRKSKLLICMLSMCMILAAAPGMESSAEELAGEQQPAAAELQDENSQRLETVTGMDENGGIFTLDDSEGTVEESGISLYSRMSSGAKVVNFRTKGNAVTYYTDEATGETGYTNGAYGADAAYLGTSGGKVKFMLSGVVGWVAEGDVQVVDLSSAASVSHYKVSNGRLIHYISQNMNLSSALSSLDNGPAPAFLEQGVTYYSYDGHYFYSDYMTMLQDYQNGSRGNSVNPDAPYYNYFQYLPFRSRTGYSADSLNSIINGKVSASSKLRDTGSVMVKYQDAYGVNALLMAGVAANESAWGTSSICMNKNNLFGLNAVDSSPGTSADTYASVEECIRQFAAGYMSGKYLNPNDWRYFGGFLGNKASGINVKYASDPYWGEKAANIAWTLDRLGGSTDSQVYTLGVKGTDAADYTSVNVRSAGNTSSKILYRTGTQPAYSVLILDAEPAAGFYRIQSDAVLSQDRQSISSGREYDFDAMYAYISADYVSVVNTGSASGTTPDETPEEPDTTPDLTPEEPDTTPDVTPGEPDTTPDVTPEEPDTTPDVTPEEPDTTPDVTPEEPDTTPDVTPEEPDTTPDVTPEEPDTTPDVTPEEPDTTPDVTPEEPDTTPDVTPEEPDTTPDVTPENNGEDSSMTGAASEEQGNTDTEAADGEKTLVVKNTTPQTAVAGTAVQIKKPAPKTGDVNTAAAWIVLLAVSGTLTASVVYRKRKSC